MAKRNGPRREFDRQVIAPWILILILVLLAMADHFFGGIGNIIP